MPYSQEIKARAYTIDRECWKSYSGKPRSFKQEMDRRRTDALVRAEIAVKRDAAIMRRIARRPSWVGTQESKAAEAAALAFERTSPFPGESQVIVESNPSRDTWVRDAFSKDPYADIAAMLRAEPRFMHSKAHAADIVICGDSVMMVPGTYNEAEDRRPPVTATLLGLPFDLETGRIKLEGEFNTEDLRVIREALRSDDVKRARHAFLYGTRGAFSGRW